MSQLSSARLAPLARDFVPSLPLGLTWSGIEFSLRTTVASLVALYIAFLGSMDDPKWAAMTVWIVAQNNRGMSLSKSRYRIVGTLIGAVVGVALIAGLAQAPELFILLLGLWLALCTYFATSLRNFRSYGAILAGYTAVIIALDSVATPEDVFTIAVSRMLYICLGIVVEAAFSAAFSTNDPVADVRAALAGYLGKAAAASAGALRLDVAPQALRKLDSDALALDVATEYAAAASTEVRRRLGLARAASGSVMSLIATVQGLREHLALRPHAADPLVEQVAILLDTAGRDMQAAIDSLPALEDEIAMAVSRHVTHEGFTERLLTLARLEMLLEGLRRAAGYSGTLASSAVRAPSRDGWPRKTRFAFHVDHAHARQNAVRSFVTVVAGAMVWIMTAWPSGSAFLVIAAVVAALFATRPNPVAGGAGFLKGGIAAALAAAACNFAILPLVDAFLPLAIVLGAFLFVAGLAMRFPRYAGPATAFAFLFLDMATPPGLADRTQAVDFFNGAVALVAGVGFGILVFSLVYPANPAAVRERLIAVTRRDLRRLATRPERWTTEAWLSLGADRLGRLTATDRIASPDQARRDLENLLSSITAGHAVILLQRLGRGRPRLVRRISILRARLAREDGFGAVIFARRATKALAKLAATGDGEERRMLIRAAILMADVAGTAGEQSDFMGGCPTGIKADDQHAA